MGSLNCYSLNGERRKPGKYRNDNLYVLFLVCTCSIRLKDLTELSLSGLCLIHSLTTDFKSRLNLGGRKQLGRAQDCTLKHNLY